MNRILGKLLLVSPVTLALSSLLSTPAIAAETGTPELTVDTFQAASTFQVAQVESSSLTNTEMPSVDALSQPISDNGMAQVTSVSQLSDVQPTDWAFQALQSLVERYGCIAGYPDGTYRGQRAMTRYEFAAGLNACLDRISELIGAATANAVTREDLAILQRLQEEFASEMEVLRGRVDRLEARITELEANQFSTTTKLTGEAAFMLSHAFGDRKADGSRDDVEENATFSHRVRVNFNTSFTGRDHLLVRMQASNATSYASATGTNMARLHPDRNNGNTFDIDLGWYTFPLSDRGMVRIEFAGGKLDDFAPSLNILDYGGAALGTISQFGQRNPIYRLSGPGVGAGFSYDLSNSFNISAGYLGGNYLSGADPSNGKGFLNGTFGAVGQLTFSPGDKFDLGLTYVRSYFDENDVSVGGGVGSAKSERPFGDARTAVDSVGGQFSFRLSPKFVLGGWGGWSFADAKNGSRDDATIVNWAVTLGFPDLFGEGNLGGIVVGMPPKVTDHNGGRDFQDRDTSLLFEAFYRHQMNDFISITPGVLVITNPEHQDNNDTIFVGTLRTTFTF